MNALTGSLPSNVFPSALDSSKAAEGFASQRHQIFQLALGISLVVVAIDYLRQRKVESGNVAEPLVVWGLCLSHVGYRTFGNQVLHLLTTLIVVGGATVLWTTSLIGTASEALFLQLLLLSVLRAVL